MFMMMLGVLATVFAHFAAILVNMAIYLLINTVSVFIGVILALLSALYGVILIFPNLRESTSVGGRNFLNYIGATGQSVFNTLNQSATYVAEMIASMNPSSFRGSEETRFN